MVESRGYRSRFWAGCKFGSGGLGTDSEFFEVFDMGFEAGFLELEGSLA